MRRELTTTEGIAKVRRDLPRLRVALRFRETIPNVVGFVSGGAPSWELISLAVEALLSDIRRDVDECERELRSELGHNWHRTPDLADALDRLAVAYEAVESRSVPSLAADETSSRVGTWVRRSALLLGDAWQPYALLGPAGSSVRCPVLDWQAGAVVECLGELWVYRHDETGVPTEIRCRKSAREHTWRTGPAWLRLGALLRDYAQ
jgi:hypothetical protein